ncbi:MarR family transcriptional regulator [Sphingomonas spermidinifaciens]|uniref:MarR family transcriptional regulator n=1 Tax=Sphingomonas spermidinifaciens TaxID=1141889 RepID=A0A2A4B4D3_9SPHN|nr:MarR family transcriptional regulator [Sphingomonas spermidinifaciens]PCD02649.1 MarR family transcriptional regulator [Sphingomonas spermidinifaciens]
MTVLNLDAFLPYRLSLASNTVSSAIATVYQSLFGLRVPEWRLVCVLAEGKGMTQQALGVRTQMDKVTVSRAAIALAERGLVERVPNPGDQRSRVLNLTDSGRELYAVVAPKALEMERALFAGFSEAERTQLRDMLIRVEQAVSAIAPAAMDHPGGPTP